MKTTTKLALSCALAMGSLTNALAADVDYPQSGPIFTQDAILVQGDVDTFWFINYSGAGTYHFYSEGADNTDTFGYFYSDTYQYLMDSDDDSGPGLGFCVEGYLLNGEMATVVVEGYTSNSAGDYTVHGASGPCPDFSAYTTGTDTLPSSDSGSFSLPAILFTVLGLGAVRLRRFFA
ncbi:MAG: hypothetical protein OEY29_15675 [Gammaproteobacteria bacterium]|nr:hypothetical protein [Gammaproteobacteria bacterium]